MLPRGGGILKRDFIGGANSTYAHRNIHVKEQGSNGLLYTRWVRVVSVWDVDSAEVLETACKSVDSPASCASCVGCAACTSSVMICNRAHSSISPNSCGRYSSQLLVLFLFANTSSIFMLAPNYDLTNSVYPLFSKSVKNLWVAKRTKSFLL